MSQNELESFLVNYKWTKESIELRRDKIVKFAKDKWCFKIDRVPIIAIHEDYDETDEIIIEN